MLSDRTPNYHSNNKGFRDIPGYEDLYQVNSHGNVRSLDHVTKKKNGQLLNVVGTDLQPCWCKKNKSYAVSLYSNGVKHKIAIAKLVWITFMPESLLGRTIDGYFELTYWSEVSRFPYLANIRRVHRGEFKRPDFK